jgi:hypothetical protein
LDVGHLVEGGEGGFTVELGGGEEDFADGHGHGGELLSGWNGFETIITQSGEKIKINFKFGFIGEFVEQNKDETSMHVYSFTRLRAGAPSRREP